MITVAEAKKELREYKQNVKYIEERQDDALELRTKLEKTTKRLTGEPKGKGENLDKDILAGSIDRMDKIVSDCDRKLQDLLLKKVMVENKIEILEQPYKTILFTVYIRAKKLTTVADEMGYEYKYFGKLHRKALQKYAEL